MSELVPTPELAPSPRPPAAALAPLREPLYRGFWIAAVISYTGTWMQIVGAGWLMTMLTTSPLMVSLVQAATALPVFLIVIPAGALGDMVDRRKLLLGAQTWMTLMAAGLGLATIGGMVTPWFLLLFTFLLGLGAVMNDPTWQAVTPEIVSPENHAAGVALNSVGFNVARALGPALGGLVVAAAGAGIAFLVNAASFFAVIVFLYRWKRRPHLNPEPARHVWSVIGAGFKHLHSRPAVKAVLVRTAVFSFSASAVLALLPLIAKPFGSAGYGLLLGSFGVGALAGAALLPWLRRSVSVDALVAAATVLFAAVTFILGQWRAFPILCLVLFAGGVAWINILASLNVAAQTMSAPWLRARAISLYLLVLQGGMAAGSAAWGAVASHRSIAQALAVAAAGLILGLAAIPNFRLGAGEFSVGSTPV